MVVSGLGYGASRSGCRCGPRHVHVSPGAAGWMWAAPRPARSSAGSPTARGGRRARMPGTWSLFIGLVGVPLLAVPLAPSLGSAMVCMFVAGLFTAPFVIAMFAIRQRSVPFELHGRIFAITVVHQRRRRACGAFLTGLVGDVGVHRLLFVAGIGQLAAAGAGRAADARGRAAGAYTCPGRSRAAGLKPRSGAFQESRCQAYAWHRTRRLVGEPHDEVAGRRAACPGCRTTSSSAVRSAGRTGCPSSARSRASPARPAAPCGTRGPRSWRGRRRRRRSPASRAGSPRRSARRGSRVPS